MNNSEISAYMGGTQVQVYLGSTLVWGRGEGDIVVKFTFEILNAGPQMLVSNNDDAPYGMIEMFDGMEWVDITSDVYFDTDPTTMRDGWFYDFDSTGTYEVRVYLFSQPNGGVVPSSWQFYNITINGNPLLSIELSGNVTEIGEYAFAGNVFNDGTYYGPNEIILPEGLEVIGNQAFEDGYYSAVTIPSTVTSIGWNAFNIGNNGEQDWDLYVTVDAETPPQLYDNGEHLDFGNPCYLHIEVPSGYESDYEADSDWYNYMTGAYCIPETCGEQGLCDDGEGNCIPCEECPCGDDGEGNCTPCE